MVARRKETDFPALKPVAPKDEARLMAAVYGPKGAYPFPNPLTPPRVLNAVIVKEDDLYVAQCLDVDVSSFGSTSTQAFKRLREAVQLHYEELASGAAITPAADVEMQGLVSIAL